MINYIYLDHFTNNHENQRTVTFCDLFFINILNELGLSKILSLLFLSLGIRKCRGMSRVGHLSSGSDSYEEENLD